MWVAEKPDFRPAEFAIVLFVLALAKTHPKDRAMMGTPDGDVQAR